MLGGHLIANARSAGVNSRHLECNDRYLKLDARRNSSFTFSFVSRGMSRLSANYAGGSEKVHAELRVRV